jgi:hypothetical protein
LRRRNGGRRDEEQKKRQKRWKDEKEKKDSRGPKDLEERRESRVFGHVYSAYGVFMFRPALLLDTPPPSQIWTSLAMKPRDRSC